MAPSDPPPDRGLPDESSSGGGGFVPYKDPVVVALAVILIGVVVVAVAGLSAGPILTGNDSDGVVFPVGELLNDTDDRDTVALSLAVDRSESTVGDPVVATVTDGDGDPVETARISVDGENHRVDDNGTATIRPGSAGELLVVASAPATNATTYEDDAITLVVDRRSVDLAVRTNDTAVTVGEQVTLALERTDTDERIAGTVTVDGVEHTTDDGTLVISSEEAGELQVVGNSSATDTERFRPGEVSLTVERRVVPLTVTATPGTVTVGEPTTIAVERTDTNAPVEATIDTGSETIETTAGRANITFETAGTHDLRATTTPTAAERFEPATTTVDVQRRTAALTLTVDRPVTTDGGTITAQLLREADRTPVAGTISVGDDEYSTPDNGSVSITLEGTDDVTLAGTAPDTTTETFLSAEQTVELGPGALLVDSIDAPDAASPGDSIVVDAVVQAGETPVTDTVVHRLDGEVHNEKLVSMDAGERRSITFTTTVPERSGTVTGVVSSGVDERSFSVRIQETS